MLGEDQLRWLGSRLKKSTAKWKLIGNQTIFSPFNVGFATADPTNLDSITLVESIFVDIWDGYPKERRRLLNRLADNPDVDNLVILTGDFHCSFAYDVPKKPVEYPNPLALNLPTPVAGYNPLTGEGSLLVEFATPSITSANFDENISPEEAIGLQFGINADIPVGPPLGTVNYNPHLKYVDLLSHGYMLLDLTEEAAQADWYYVNILEANDDTQNYGSGQLTVDGSRHLSPASGEAAEKEQQPDLAPAPSPVQVGLTGASSSETASFTALNVFPIPVKTGSPIFIHYALNSTADFRAELIDANGRVVKSLSEKNQPAGTYALALPTDQELAAGIYFLKIGTPDETTTRKVIVE